MQGKEYFCIILNGYIFMDSGDVIGFFRKMPAGFLSMWFEAFL